uniref:Tubulin polyglutamylase TTLL4-like n=1 Tax=Petromyzon marinus TaxID=7757 RepID=A0AAJ7WX23_PETMA|nr:tubulin polyglutamylase TTLL4-like [Petromyzon marinus]
MALAPPPLSAGHCGTLRRELGPDAGTGGPAARGRPAGAATPQLGDGSPPPRTDAGGPRHRARRLRSPAPDVVGPASTTRAPCRAGSGEPWLTGRRRVQSARPSVRPAPRPGAASPALGETTLFGQWQRSDFLRGQSLRGNSRTAAAGLGTGGGGDCVLPRIVSRSSARPGTATHRPRDVSTTQQVARKPGAHPAHRTSPKPPAHVNLLLRQTTVNLLLDGTAAAAAARFVENTVPAVETIHDHRLLNGANAGSVGMPVGAAAHGGVTDTSSGPELPVMQLTAAVQRLAAGAARSGSEPTVNPPGGPIASLRESPPSVRPTTLTRKPNPSSCKAKSDRAKNPEAKPSASRTRGGPGNAPVRRVGPRLTGKGSGMSAAHSGQGQSGRELGQRGWRPGGPPSELGSGDCGQDGEEEEEDGSEAVEDDGSEDSSAQSVDLDGDDEDDNDDDEEELPDGPDEVGDEVDVSDGTSSDDDGGDYAAALDLAVSTAACSVPGSAQDGQLKPALVPSIFDNVPPTVYFGTAEETIAMLPWPLRRKLKWKMSPVTPQVVRKTLARSHFRPTAKRHDWLGCWGRHMKSPGFRALREHQKLNHFPGSFQIGRKDRLWRNLSRLRARFGRRSFGFVPRSFVLPQDTRALRLAWAGAGGGGGGGGGAATHMRWIVKPPASARGIGIKVVSKWSQLPKKRPLLVQRYLHKPYLIEGSKFDLRIYVYVSSYNPLRVYVFKDGLVRFASCKYSSATKTLGNRFMHLTNYSVNRNNTAYKSNDDRTQCEGHKWALKALWGYLCDKGVDCRTIWEQIKDIAVKTVIASEPFVSSLLAQFVGNRRSCHELFGFDVMLDEKLKPWLLEVNISPSLHSNSPLDVAVKGQLIKDLLNMAGFQIPASLQGGGDGARTVSDVATNERSKHAFYLSPRNLDERGTLLDTLTPGDVRVLVEAEDELRRCGRFERAFPSPSARYLVFFAQQRYHDLLLHRWALAHPPGTTAGIDLLKRLCKKGVHLGPTEDPAHIWTPSARSEPRPRAVVTCEAASARAAKPPAKQPEEREKVPTPGPQVCGISSSLGLLALSQTQGVHRALRTAGSVGDVA